MYLDAIRPFIPIPGNSSITKTQISINPKGKILMHPFAGWKEKEWGLKKFINLAKQISKEYEVCFVVPHDHIENDIFDEIRNSEIESISTDTTDKLIKFIKDCLLFIGNDSGPVNIANYLGKPTMTIYGATNPVYTETGTDHQLVMQKTIRCSAGLNEKYCFVGPGVINCPGIECMNLLAVDEVHTQVFSLLKKYCSQKSVES